MTHTDRPFWLVEDTSSGHLRRNGSNDDIITLRLYKVHAHGADEVARTSYEAGRLRGRRTPSRAELVLDLIRTTGAKTEPVVCSHRTASPNKLARLLSDAGLEFVLEIPPDAPVRFLGRGRPLKVPTPLWKLRRAAWFEIESGAPESEAIYAAAEVGSVEYAGVRGLHCFALSAGDIADYRRGLLIGVTNGPSEILLEERARLLGWLRWIRPVVRRTERVHSSASTGNGGKARDSQLILKLDVRANLQIARELDHRSAAERETSLFGRPKLRGVLASNRTSLKVVELFAGAGGMGLGFLLANSANPPQYRIMFSGEVDETYVHSLVRTHRYMCDNGLIDPAAVPESVEPIDLGKPEALRSVSATADAAGGVDILIGGPPCQGLSNANRNSWSSSNPNNRLIDTFLDYVDLLNPRVLLLENVQGILWTPRGIGDQISIAEHVSERLAAAGYRIFPKILDAAWYGVPQHRNRFFLLGLHQELGYHHADFGVWGPYPLPTHGPGTERGYVTVAEAVEDLPPVPNGWGEDEQPYDPADTLENEFLAYVRDAAPRGVIWDHVTSRHADYVIERYRRISVGGNWKDVVELMTNYADIERTHSNIYRRLRWDEPSITIGHYRKSMIVHPSQDRGLSLREAMRLQGFPDWVRLAGAREQLRGGLTHKQQQLANAVSPPVTRAIADYLAQL